MTNYKLIEDVTKGPLLSAYVNAPFEEGKKLLESKGYRIISLEENARLRIQEGSNSSVSKNGNWVSEDAIYVPNRGVFLTKKSPIMDNSERATQESRNGDFYLTDEQVEKYLECAVKLINQSIPTNRFGKNEITKYAFGETAEDYGNFLKENGIEKMPIWLADMPDKPFARKLWFRRLNDDWSDLCCNGRGLFDVDRVRGVSDVNTEGAKIFLGERTKIEYYTPTQISNTLGNLNLSGLENLILEDLRNQ